jgi:SnoaL-like domain
MEVTAFLRAFCEAVERRDGQGFASLFSDDGVYHDAFYGAFAGRAKIAELINDWFYRTARDFHWDMLEPLTDGHTLYARYAFGLICSDLAFEPGLFEPKSLLPGNGILRAETKGPKRLRNVRVAVAETKPR